MEAKDWVKAYPEIATALFNCSVEDLCKMSEKHDVNTREYGYLTKADMDRYIKTLNK